MARRPKPWYRQARGARFVVNGTQPNSGPDKKLAVEQFYAVIRQPQERKVDPRFVLANIGSSELGGETSWLVTIT